MTEQHPSRRIVFTGMAGLGVAVALAGCGGGSGSSGGSGGDSSGGSASGGSSSSAPSGTALASTSEVPEGGGLILADQKVVITQPTKGTFEAFSAVCTHQGFIVTSVEDDTIKCNHHGSEYSAEDGSVKGGPAPKGLAKVAIQVQGDQIMAA